MKKRLGTALLATMMTVGMAVPAFASQKSVNVRNAKSIDIMAETECIEFVDGAVKLQDSKALNISDMGKIETYGNCKALKLGDVNSTKAVNCKNFEGFEMIDFEDLTEEEFKEIIEKSGLEEIGIAVNGNFEQSAGFTS